MSPAAPDSSFIEVQFPISKLSKESYKERKANYSQTLTGLGKWWGRKPLVLVRAVILGLLLPATGDPKRDREVFLKLMTMDEEGLWKRKTKRIAMREIYAHLPASERAQWFAPECDPERPRFRRGVTKAEKEQLQRRVFESFNYDGKLDYCDRPEQIDGPSEEAWAAINAYLGMKPSDLPGLVRELGQLRFGHIRREGDAFCGGGSVPFEAARLGCEAYGSDLNRSPRNIWISSLRNCMTFFMGGSLLGVRRAIRNPWDLTRSPGGSSGGGSIRIPSSVCGKDRAVFPV
jgi:putative DNA methylase